MQLMKSMNGERSQTDTSGSKSEFILLDSNGFLAKAISTISRAFGEGNPKLVSSLAQQLFVLPRMQQPLWPAVHHHPPPHCKN